MIESGGDVEKGCDSRDECDDGDVSMEPAYG